MSRVVADTIRRARKSRGWSVPAAARALIAASEDPLPELESVVRAWKRWERGTIPSAQYRPLLAGILGVSPTMLDGPESRGSSARGGAALAAADLWREELGMAPDEFVARIVVDPPTPARVGWTDVQHVRETTRAFAAAENLYGGGYAVEAALGQLRWASRLPRARSAVAVRRSMLEALGNLSGVVAFAAFDCAAYATADRCFELTLWCADEAGSWPLRACTLADMARRAASVGEIDEALTLVEHALVRSDRVSTTAQAMLHAAHARYLALWGRSADAVDAARRADEAFGGRDASEDPPWLCYYDEAEHHGSVGRALLPVAVERRNLALAAPRLAAAVDLQRPDYPRSRVFSQIRLATLTIQIGDPRHAAAIAQRAIDDARLLRSQRVLDELRTLGGHTIRHTGIPDVAELREQIASVGAA